MSSRHRKHHQSIILGKEPILHCYSLWINLLEQEHEYLIVQEIISSGEFGMMKIEKHKEIIHKTDESFLEPSQNLHNGNNKSSDVLVSHNKEEYSKITEECKKWEQRLSDSPLGKTEQNLVVYYHDLIERFNDWFTMHESHMI
ncbi:MAG: hypothetical protein ACHQQQ_10290 [Bacteroidota bacterium]